MKTTAAAALMAFILTGCGGGGSKGASSTAEPQPVNNVVEQAVEQPTAQPATPSAPTQNTTASTPAPEATPSAPAATPAPEATPSAPVVTPTPTPNVAQGQRVIDLRGKVSGDADMKWLSVIGTENSFVSPFYGAEYINTTDIQVDLSKLSANQLGVHSGTFSHPDLIVKDGTGKNELNYLFVNQPYSSYGFLVDNASGADSETRNHRQAFAFVRDNVADVIKSNDEGISLEDTPFKGSAHYRGTVVANIDYTTKPFEGFANVDYSSELKQDGTVEMTADFDKNRISGYLNSDTLGKVRLTETSVSGLSSKEFSGTSLEKEGVSAGTYYGNISSNGADVVGTLSDVEFKDIDINGEKKSGYYEAAFGGTKQ